MLEKSRYVTVIDKMHMVYLLRCRSKYTILSQWQFVLTSAKTDVKMYVDNKFVQKVKFSYKTTKYQVSGVAKV